MANEKWFTSLPADELTPLEAALRKVCLKAIDLHTAGPFPLGEWINRRIGGEVEVRTDEKGHIEIYRRGTAPAAATSQVPNQTPEAFFSSLSADNFAPPEEALRGAIFEFLASWRSPELATIRELSEHPEVVRRGAAFLPRSVRLKDWIEHRIGGEIEFHGQRNGYDVIHLSESAKSTVMIKFQEIQARAGGMPPVGPPVPGMPPMGMPPMGGPPPMGGFGGPPPNLDKNAWFGTLPGEELLPPELALREALLGWLKSRPASSVSLQDAGPEVERLAQTFLHPKVKFHEWIERRIGGEIELRSLGSGKYDVYLRGTAPAQASSRTRERAATPEEKEAFFATLSNDEFSVGEEKLREALLACLERVPPGSVGLLHEASQEEAVARQKREVLPKNCPVRLQDWIDRRIGGEIETRAEGNGKVAFFLRGTNPPPAAGGGGGSANKRRRT